MLSTRLSAEELADIAVQSAATARALGHEPRVAMLAYSTFGHPMVTARFMSARPCTGQPQRRFEYDGEIAADVALNREAMRRYPFCRLSEPANVLVMPSSASISTKMLEELGNATLIGPILMGLNQSVQIARIGATATEVSIWRRLPPMVWTK